MNTTIPTQADAKPCPYLTSDLRQGHDEGQGQTPAQHWQHRLQCACKNLNLQIKKIHIYHQFFFQFFCMQSKFFIPTTSQKYVYLTQKTHHGGKKYTNYVTSRLHMYVYTDKVTTQN